VGKPRSLRRRGGTTDESGGLRPEGLSSATRILIVADSLLHREALVHLIASRHVGFVSATPPGEALARVHADRSDVALLDVAPTTGLALVAKLRFDAPEVKSVVIGVSEEEGEVVPWAEAGVAGYVTLDDSLDDLLATIASVLDGEAPCSPRISAALLRRVETLASAGATASVGALTVRETQVADLLADGLSNKEIALSLSIALPTVKAHVHSILGKLKAHRRGEAVARMRPAQNLLKQRGIAK
jgi:two-component system, NarL family, nitrate/nitrite response regulator NarL